MQSPLERDRADFNRLLDLAVASAKDVLASLSDRPVGVASSHVDWSLLPDDGIGAEAALEVFSQKYADYLSGSAGARYFGFVTGGVTPAALLGDWLAATYGQNATGSTESIAPQLELEALAWLRTLFGLSEAHTGSFVSGATMSNVVGLAIARQWLGQRQGIDIAQQGVAALGTVEIFSGTTHSSIYKAAAMLGLGRDAIRRIPTRDCR